MKRMTLLLLFMIAPAVLAQEVFVPEDSMRDAWSEDQQQFESLSSDYGGYSDNSYGYSSLEDNSGLDTTTEPGYDSTMDETDRQVTDDSYRHDRE